MLLRQTQNLFEFPRCVLLQEAERQISMHNMAAKETQIGEHNPQRKNTLYWNLSQTVAVLSYKTITKMRETGMVHVC